MHFLAYMLIGDFCLALLYFVMGWATPLTTTLFGFAFVSIVFVWFVDTHSEEDKTKHIPFKEKLKRRQNSNH